MSRNVLRSMVYLGLLAMAGALAGCGPSGGYPSGERGEHYAGLECVPFARELSGIALYGEAADWWDIAAGRYDRASRPVVGGVLVFRRSGRLPSGHVSVVSKLLGPRQIAVIQANWVSREVDLDQLVVDVSEDNDWSEVRVWWPPVNQLGATTYDTYGFILPGAQATHDQLARATRNAAVIAVSASRGRPSPSARSYGG